MRLILLLGLLGVASAVSYSGDQLVRVLPREQKDFEWLERLENHREIVEFWRPTSVQGLRKPVSVDIRIPRVNVERVTALLEQSKIEYKVMAADMQVLIDNQFDSPTRQTKLKGDDYDYSEYHTYDEIMTWANDIAFSYPSIASLEVLTYSSEGRSLPVLTIGSSQAFREILVVCGEHAREWISPAVCQCLVGRLTDQYGNDSVVTDMVDRITWTIIPLLNPDGYNYSWVEHRLLRVSSVYWPAGHIHVDLLDLTLPLERENSNIQPVHQAMKPRGLIVTYALYSVFEQPVELDRNWKKTRSEYRENRCIGVDINSNFDIDYSGPGSSFDSCAENYMGPVVESEPEVYALAELLRNNYYDEYFTFHAYGEEILYPYFYSQTVADNYKNLQYVGRRAAEAMFIQYETIYEVAPGYADLPLKAGKSVDYAYSQGVGLAYQIELRDTGEYGYLLPESEIVPTCTEAFVGMEVFAKELFPE